jgi:tetratricopeptide (TPR) repeat protein
VAFLSRLQRGGIGQYAAVVLFALALLSWPRNVLFAQDARVAITVSGTVRTSTGEPVAGASVFVEEKGSSRPFETKTKVDGTFKALLDHGGWYTVRAQKAGLRGSQGPFVLSAGEKKHLDLVLVPQPAPATMEFKDEPDFTVAGVTDWSNVGLHGSDTTSRTSEALAKETVNLKGGFSEKSSGVNSGSRYAVALESEAKGDLPQAREQVRKVLATSNDAEGHHLLGDLDERLGDPLQAVREYERAARMYPSEQNYFDWGAELLLHKAAQPAVEVFSKGSALHPRSARMLAGLGAALYGVGSYEDAARRLCDASDLRPADPAPYLFLGQMEKTVSVPLPCTEEKLARFVQDQPASALANYYYAASLWKRRRGSESPTAARQVEALLEKAVKLDPSLGEAYVQLGVLYFAQNEFTKSIQAFQQAIRVSPQLTEAHYRLSLAYKRAGDEAKAHEEFEAYQQAEKTEAATVERQRGELKQFLIILKNQPAATPQ